MVDRLVVEGLAQDVCALSHDVVILREMLSVAQDLLVEQRAELAALRVQHAAVKEALRRYTAWVVES